MAGRAPPGAVTRRGRAAQRVVAGREDVRTPARPVVALSASSGPRWGRPSSVRASGVQASGVQASGASGCPDGHAPVSAALPPRFPRRAGPRSWLGVAGRPSVGRSGSTCRRGPRAAWSPACIGPDGKGRGGGCRCLLAGGSTLAQGRRLAGVPAAAPPGRRADTGAGPGQGAGRVAREAWDRAAAHRPAGRPGQVGRRGA
jgi:hypothetical protein